MKVKRSQVGRGFWLQWVLASTVGMLVGMVIAVVLAVFSEILFGGLGDLPFELAWGIGLGIGVGLLQWLVLRRRVSGVGWWVLASAAGGFGILQAGFLGFSQSLES